jgi:predicted short-subunit dehydrogenase-like oxidoreductase (DUF2520 family)
MRNQPFKTVVLIGAGNVATHIGLHLNKIGVQVLKVWSRTTDSSKQLAHLLGTEACTDLAKMNKQADLYLISIPDHAITNVLKKLDLPPESFVVHTSGSLPIGILQGITNHFGVFYPVQTFSKGHVLSFDRIPICVEADNLIEQQRLKDFAGSFTNQVIETDSSKRATIHLAAVFACNFTNHLYQVACELMERENVPFLMLSALIEETAAKALWTCPGDAQTGPAARGDQQVIDRHLGMLENEPVYREIYRLLTKSIAAIQSNIKT